MARIVIDFPEKIIYYAEIVVRVSDVNYGGHVGNDAILRLMQDARVLFYRSIGIKDELTIDGKIGQIVTDSAVVYKSESFLGDVIRVAIAVDGFNKYGFDMYYQLSNKDTGKDIASGKTGILCFDYERRKVASIPPAFLEKLNTLKQ